MVVKENSFSMMKSSLNDKINIQSGAIKKKDDTICNFFQSSMNKLAKCNSESGVHLVGPMFEMTAWMDNKIANYEFELEFPVSSVSFGPTICSFGLDYNDHNYALPTGLTPPSMAPHLVDLNIPFKSRKDTEFPNFENDQVIEAHLKSPLRVKQSLNSIELPKILSPSAKSLDSHPQKVIIREELCPNDVTNQTKLKPTMDSLSGKIIISPFAKKKPVTILDKSDDRTDKVTTNVNQFNDGMSESKKKLFSAWHAKAAESGHLVVAQNWPCHSDNMSIKGRYKAKQDNVFEMRHGHEPKLIEIPEYLAVSPSALSDTDEETEVQAPEPFGASGMVNGAELNPSDFPTWFLLRCGCGIRNTKQRLVRCMQCKYWQHLDCMMAMYTDIEQRNTAKLAHIYSNTGSSRRHNSRLVPDVSKCSGKGALEFAANKTANKDNENPSYEELQEEEAKRTLVTISPNNYVCELCGERPVNVEIAQRIQSMHNESEEIQMKNLNLIKEANAHFLANLKNIDFEKNSQNSESGDKPARENDDKRSNCSETELVDTAQIVDRAVKLGLIEEPKGDPKNPKNKALIDDINHLINQAATEAASSSADKAIANHKAKLALEAMNANKEKAIHEALDAGKKKLETTDVNQRVPSPPRASKRKQDLSNQKNQQAAAKPPATTTEHQTASQELTAASTKENTPAVNRSQIPYSPATMGNVAIDPKLTTAASYPLKRTLFQDQLAASQGTTGRVRGGYNTILKRYATAAAMIAESNAAMYNPLGNAWTKNYREADNNIYTKPLISHIGAKLALNIDINYGVPPHSITRNPLCRVVMFDHNDKGLEASISLSCNEVIIEARGKLMLLEEYEHYRDPYSDYNRYAFIYKKFSDRAIVLDASLFGNDARFIRRSCIPNCNLDHIIIKGKLHLVVRTLMDVTPGNELTLPFDIDYRALHYPIDCACGRSRCPVQKWSRKLIRNKVVPSMDYSKYIESQLKVLSTPLNPEVPAANSMYSQQGHISNNPYESSIIGSPNEIRSSPWSTPSHTPIKNMYPKSPTSMPSTPVKNYMVSPGGGSVTVKRKLASGCSIIKEVSVSPNAEIIIGESMEFKSENLPPKVVEKTIIEKSEGKQSSTPWPIQREPSEVIEIEDSSDGQTPQKKPRKAPISIQEDKMNTSSSRRARRKKQILDI